MSHHGLLFQCWLHTWSPLETGHGGGGGRCRRRWPRHMPSTGPEDGQTTRRMPAPRRQMDMSTQARSRCSGGHSGQPDRSGTGCGRRWSLSAGSASSGLSYGGWLIALFRRVPRQACAEYACLLSAVLGMLRESWRSLAQPRWVLYWLLVSSLIWLLLWCFMPQRSAIDIALQSPLHFLKWRFNLLLFVAAWVVLDGAKKIGASDD